VRIPGISVRSVRFVLTRLAFRVDAGACEILPSSQNFVLLTLVASSLRRISTFYMITSKRDKSLDTGALVGLFLFFTSPLYRLPSLDLDPTKLVVWQTWDAAAGPRLDAYDWPPRYITFWSIWQRLTGLNPFPLALLPPAGWFPVGLALL